MSDTTSSGSLSRVQAARRRYNLIGGLILAIAGLILLGSTFLVHSSVPLELDAGIILFTAVGIAISGGFLKVQNPQDFYGGEGAGVAGPVSVFVPHEPSRQARLS